MPEFDQEQIVRIRAMIDEFRSDKKEEKSRLERLIDAHPLPILLGVIVAAVGVTFAVINSLDDRVDKRLEEMAPNYVSNA